MSRQQCCFIVNMTYFYFEQDVETLLLLCVRVSPSHLFWTRRSMMHLSVCVMCSGISLGGSGDCFSQNIQVLRMRWPKENRHGGGRSTRDLFFSASVRMKREFFRFFRLPVKLFKTMRACKLVIHRCFFFYLVFFFCSMPARRMSERWTR